MGKYYIKIVVEGSEENTFFEIVKNLGTSDVFCVDVEDATGYGNVSDVFLNALRQDYFDCVICVYDVDNRVNDLKSPFNITRSRLISIFGSEKIADAVSFCTNPNILQYFLLAADKLNNVSLASTSKEANSRIVNKYWPEIASGKKDAEGRKIKSNYSASSWQLDIIKYSILNNEYPYDALLENAKELNADYKNNLPGGNLLPLLIALKEGDTNFFKKINELIGAIVD